jgi:hypothetical protein
MNIEDDAEEIVINTTDIHLPRRIAEAIKRAFHGEMKEEFKNDEYFVRIYWSRAA